MREIKFRAWNEVMEKMFTWNDFLNTNMKNTFIAPKSTAMILMQYTGLHDKNGKEIYEGDITDDGYNNIGVVKYGNYNCSCCEGVYGWYVDGGDIRSAECFLKVIGNIYENPELLKGVDNIE